VFVVKPYPVTRNIYSSMASKRCHYIHQVWWTCWLAGIKCGVNLPTPSCLQRNMSLWHMYLCGHEFRILCYQMMSRNWAGKSYVRSYFVFGTRELIQIIYKIKFVSHSKETAGQEFSSSRLWRCIPWLASPDVSNELVAFIFKSWGVQEDSGNTFLRNVGRK
jgi:hypothetical protein